jgi:hypothetical protein
MSLSSHGTSTVTLTSGTDLPSHGTEPVALQQAMCPAGQVVAGFEGNAFMDTMSGGTYVAMLVIHCAPLAVAGVPDAPVISLGPSGTLPPIGSQTGYVGIAIPPTDCPEGEIAVASRGQSGSVLDAFGLGCATPAMQCTPGTQSATAPFHAAPSWSVPPPGKE